MQFILHIGCTVPDVANGVATYDSLTPGSVVEFSCNTGYAMDGNKKIKCTDSDWNRDPPVCNPSKHVSLFNKYTESDFKYVYT